MFLAWKVTKSGHIPFEKDVFLTTLVVEVLQELQLESEQVGHQKVLSICTFATKELGINTLVVLLVALTFMKQLFLFFHQGSTCKLKKIYNSFKSQLKKFSMELQLNFCQLEQCS